MSEDKTSKAETIARSVEKISDSKGLAEIGKGLGAGLTAFAVAFGVVGFYLAIMAGSKWDGHLSPPPKCFELQEISGKVFKVNSCTGEITEYETPKEIQKETHNK